MPNYKRKYTAEEQRQLLELRRSSAASPHKNRKRYDRKRSREVLRRTLQG